MRPLNAVTEQELSDQIRPAFYEQHLDSTMDNLKPKQGSVLMSITVSAIDVAKGYELAEELFDDAFHMLRFLALVTGRKINIGEVP